MKINFYLKTIHNMIRQIMCLIEGIKVFLEKIKQNIYIGKIGYIQYIQQNN